MKKSGHIKPHIHVKNKTKGVKDTKHNIFYNALYLIDFFNKKLLKQTH